MDGTQIAQPPAAGTLATLPTGEPGCFTASLPPGAAGQWCRVSATLHRPGAWWIRVSAFDEARGQVVREAFLGKRRGATRTLLLHIPRDASRLTLTVLAEGQAGATAPVLRLRVLRRSVAAAQLVAFGWRKLPGCVRGDRSGLAGRVRSELGQAPARAGEAPPYDVWCRLYQGWDDTVRRALMPAVDGLAQLEVVIAPPQDPLASAEPLVAASLASLEAQWSRPARIVVAGPDAAAWQRAPGNWLLVLYAGERLIPSATACFALAVARCPAGARLIYADADELHDGVRADPLFKPPADPWLRESGLLTRGCCAVHPDVGVGAVLAADDPRALLAAGMSAAAMHRIGLILTHVPAGTPAARPQAPPSQTADTLAVTIIVASACRSPHVLRCLRGLVDTTNYANLEILVASRIDQGDRRQQAVLDEVSRLPAVRVVDTGLDVFNYAAVNNLAAREARGELLLLLNDDVLPIGPDWLRRMVAFTAAGPEQADIVGARLLYGNDRVQHAGVIVGLANLCENAFRLSERADAGPHGIARLDRQVCAVTAACMLIRRSVWQEHRGFDESFCIALNDVDFCLRAGQAGARIVFAAGVELYHFESLSLGRHYQGERAALEVREVHRLRDRWQSLIANDPFYNPQASLEPGREFQPAFPPRLTPLAWIAGEDAAGR